MTGRTGARRRAAVRGAVGASLAAVVLVASGASALAGEIKGPLPDGHTGEPTGALEHAASACAASGLNDYDPAEGQNDRRVQTPADAWRYYELPKGAPGRLGLCRGSGAG